MVKSAVRGAYTIYDYPQENFEELEYDWKELENGTDMTAFQSYEWYRNICAMYRRERTKNLFRSNRYIKVSKNEKTVLIAPLEIQKYGVGYRGYGLPRGVFFIGRAGYTDYLNFIYDSFDSEALEQVIAYVCGEYRQTAFYLQRMLESAESYRYLTQSYQVERTEESAYALEVPQAFDDYTAQLSKSTRQNIRTALNREKKDGVLLDHVLLLNESLPIKEEIAALNRQRLRHKQRASKKEMSVKGRIYCALAGVFRKFFSAKHDVLMKSKETFCFLVKHEERIVSFYWGIRSEQTKSYYVILVGVDEAYGRYSPNIAHLYLFVKECCENPDTSIKVLDFSRGAEGYKKTIGCKKREVFSLRFSAQTKD